MMATRDDDKVFAFEALNTLLMELHGYVTPEGRQDLASRPVVCTPYEGAYGQAGWVVALEGSPPRGTIVLAECELFITPPFAIYFTQAGLRRLKSKPHLDVLRAFWKLWLEGQTEAFTLSERMLP